MPIRNPFAKRQADEAGLRPPLTFEPALKASPGFERVDTVGSKASSAVSITSRRSQDTGEYKMSGMHELCPSTSTRPGRIPPSVVGCCRMFNYTSQVNPKVNCSVLC